MEPLLIPMHILQRLLDADFQNTPRLLLDPLIQEAKILIQ